MRPLRVPPPPSAMSWGCHLPTGMPTHGREPPPPPWGGGNLESHTSQGPCGPRLCGWLWSPTLLLPPARPIHRYLLTSAGWLCLVPLGVMGVNALNDDGALLQCVARVAAELHGGAHRVGGGAAAEVAVFDKGLIAVALLEGCKPWGPAQLSLSWAKRGADVLLPPAPRPLSS